MIRTLDEVLDSLRLDYKRPILNLVDGVWTYYNGCKSSRGELEFLYLGDITDPTTPHLDTELGGEDIHYLPSLEMLTGKEEQTIQTLTNLERAVYQTYSNYPAINVNKVKDIPSDYKGLMGVPVNFLTKHCSSQFRIVDRLNNPKLGEKTIYKRVIIERI